MMSESMPEMKKKVSINIAFGYVYVAFGNAAEKPFKVSKPNCLPPLSYIYA